MFDKLKAGLAVLRHGNEVSNVEAWKTGQITGTVLGALFIALANLAQAFDYPFPLDADSANAVGAGLVALVNIILTSATSKRAGILPAAKPDGESDSQINLGMSHPGISQATRDAAMRSVSQTNDPLAGLDTTYTP